MDGVKCVLRRIINFSALNFLLIHYWNYLLRRTLFLRSFSQIVATGVVRIYNSLVVCSSITRENRLSNQHFPIQPIEWLLLALEWLLSLQLIGEKGTYHSFKDGVRFQSFCGGQNPFTEYRALLMGMNNTFPKNI